MHNGGRCFGAPMARRRCAGFEFRLVRSDRDGLIGVGLSRGGRRRAGDKRQTDGDENEAGSSAAHGTSVCYMLGRVEGAKPGGGLHPRPG